MNVCSVKERIARIRTFSSVVMNISLIFCAYRGNVGAESLTPGSSSWYCHEGSALLHAGHKNSIKSLPTDWDIRLLAKAGDDFRECYRRSDDETVQALLAREGYAQSRLDMAQTYNALSVFTVLFEKSQPRDAFRKLHDLALESVRYSMEALQAADDSLHSNAGAELGGDALLKMSESLEVQKAAVNATKDMIVATTFESLPRSRTELSAFIDAGRLPMVVVSSTWGLTTQEAGESKSTPITFDNDASGSDAVDAASPPVTELRVSVSASGNLTAAHIAQSSGSSDADVAAMTRVYALKFHPATNNCVPIDSTSNIEL